MNKEINILFLGGAKRVSLAEYFIESGKAKNINVNIFSYELTPYVPIDIVGKVIIGLKWNDPQIYNHLIETVTTYNINIILPFLDPAILIACSLKKELPDVFIPCSNAEICNITFDKKRSAEWFAKEGFPIPKDYSDSDSIKEFPIILKPRNGSASKGLQVINNPKEFYEFAKVHLLDDYLIQQYICPAIEYTVDAYISCQRKIISIVPRVRLETVGGEAIRTITERNESIISLSKDIITKGQFQGPITIQFLKEEKSGTPYLMEINPRFGGGVIASIAAGANTSSCIIDEFLGVEPSPIIEWRENILITRYLKEVVFQCD